MKFGEWMVLFKETSD